MGWETWQGGTRGTVGDEAGMGEWGQLASLGESGGGAQGRRACLRFATREWQITATSGWHGDGQERALVEFGWHMAVSEGESDVSGFRTCGEGAEIRWRSKRRDRASTGTSRAGSPSGCSCRDKLG